MKIVQSCVWLCLTAFSVIAMPQESASLPFLALTNANVIDGISNQPRRQITVLVRDGKILAVGTIIPDGATIIDLKGRWLLPGLIDAHVHVTDVTAQVVLKSGITTVRTGSAGINIRDRHRAGDVEFPDVVASRAQVARQPPAAFFNAFTQLADFRDGLRGPDDMRRTVAALTERGADVIKIMATERAGLAEADPRRRVFTDEELVAAVQTATQSGRPVMAHAHADDGAAAAVRAGVRSIEHGTYLSDATLSLMKDRGTFLVPTLAVGLRDVATDGPGPEPSVVVAERSKEMLPLRRAVAAKAWEMGVRIVAGSDSSYNDDLQLPSELQELVRVGMSPMDAIKAATSVAAECLTIQARTGAIRPGLEADLIVVETDPTVDIRAVRDVVVVLNNGRPAVNRLQR
jgi:imidazolonepropionase-like amidohydrolase